MADIAEAVIQDLHERYAVASRGPQELLDPDTVEMLVDEMHRYLDKLNRLANVLIGQQRGLTLNTVRTLQDLKIDFSKLRYHLDHRET